MDFKNAKHLKVIPSYSNIPKRGKAGVLTSD